MYDIKQLYVFILKYEWRITNVFIYEEGRVDIYLAPNSRPVPQKTIRLWPQ